MKQFIVIKSLHTVSAGVTYITALFLEIGKGFASHYSVYIQSFCCHGQSHGLGMLNKNVLPLNSIYLFLKEHVLIVFSEWHCLFYIDLLYRFM